MTAPFSYDVTTPIGQIRLLIGDTDYSAYTFTDAELGSCYSLAGNNVFNGAALAVESQARGAVRLSEQIRSSDGSMVKRRPISEWLALATSLRQAALNGTLQTGEIDVSEPGDILESFHPGWRNILDLPVVE